MQTSFAVSDCVVHHHQNAGRNGLTWLSLSSPPAASPAIAENYALFIAHPTTTAKVENGHKKGKMPRSPLFVVLPSQDEGITTRMPSLSLIVVTILSGLAGWLVGWLVD